ncbi:hypothetical protein CAP31_14455 [Sulfuriferula sp. AH1]|uniref:diguanylate cyclase domain-containing protein n=1 Tax=Sulfuriferula sp. AH1 TaxID=1985873 RepID=UPI000B3B9C82|nr:diguanylate cyclase [Sulfuriferula sp. AH1]ARU32760.1 hypothetical protein CAP31_14455 [Sulfuriferula sp. AH1]
MSRDLGRYEELDSNVFIKSVLAAFIVLIVLVLTQIGYGVNQLDELQQKTEEVTARQFEKLRLLNDAESAGVRRSALLVRMSLSKDDLERKNLYAEFQQSNNLLSLVRQLSQIEKDPNERLLLDEQFKNLQKIIIAQSDVLNMLEVGNTEAAQSLLKNEVMDQQNSVRAAFVNLREHQQKQVQEMLVKTQTEYNATRNAILWTGLFVVIAVVVISFIVLRRARRHVHNIETKLISLEASRLRLHKKATRDALTGLANKSQLNSYLQQKILEHAKRKSFAVMYLDLDGFKKINDEYGHAVGDRLLALASQRMQGMLRNYDFIARVGGDEFAIIMQENEDAEIATLVAKKLIAFLGEPFSIGSVVCNIGVSVGLAFYPEHGVDGAQLLHNADQAMYCAKRNGKNQYAIHKATE